MIATYVGLIFFLLWTLVPFFWMFLASVKTNKEIYQTFTIFPEIWTFEHYRNLFSATGTGRSRPRRTSAAGCSIARSSPSW